MLVLDSVVYSFLQNGRVAGLADIHQQRKIGDLFGPIRVDMNQPIAVSVGFSEKPLLPSSAAGPRTTRMTRAEGGPA